MRLLARISTLWQRKRPLPERTTDKILAVIEKSVIIDCQTRRAITISSLAEGVRKATKIEVTGLEQLR